MRWINASLVTLFTILVTSCMSTTQILTPVETPRLIVQDKTGILSQKNLEKLAQDADKTLLDILRIWSAYPRIQRLGKIRLVIEHPPYKNARGAIFYWSIESGRRVRTVGVWGIDGQPYGMAHKLTHALFPNRDKLIRNMMGIYSEKLIGNPNSFPMCGFSNDAWALVLLQLGSIVPLVSLGPDHHSWGMEFQNRKPISLDLSRRHAAYAEAGSFGEYLIRTYGINNMKKFHRLSLTIKRPWEDAFGLSLDALEADWIRYLKSEFEANANDVFVLKRLRKVNPDAACNKARGLASDRKF
ncbi:MAG: hypothetical protein PVJ69_11295 [Desulfobacteraceae bacterium]|jgi:hypothetical protein